MRNYIEKKNIKKKEAKKLGLCTSAFIRQTIIDKVSYNNKLKEIEDRIVKLENKK
jgi:hypothetical protein